MGAELETLAAVIDAAAPARSAAGGTRGARTPRHLPRRTDRDRLRGPRGPRDPRVAPVRRLALVGTYADGAAIAPRPLQEALASTVRAHWGAGARVLADIWMPGADPDLRDRFAAYQRASATPDTAANLLSEVYTCDVRHQLAEIDVPALVVHRRDDRAMPFAGARELAAALPDAELVALDGDVHPPWLGDPEPVLAALLTFLRSG